tara:strand:- start:90 stop:824 length:735 start_codon:yes stop_codon:yes gene_type:complete
MKKRNFRALMGAVALLASVVLAGAPTAHAGAPGDGVYLGFFGGYTSGIVSGEVSANSKSTSYAGTTAKFNDGGLGLVGGEYGAWLGAGKRMGPLYAGIDLDYASSDAKIKLSSTTAVDLDDYGTDITEISADVLYTTGPSGRVGVYINENTLLTAKAGIQLARFEAKTTGGSDKFYGGGPRYGVSMESTVLDGLAVRIEWLYTDYDAARVASLGTVDSSPNSDVKIGGSMHQSRAGLVYTLDLF